MTTVQIEVDRDVFAALERRVKGFSDTPNSVLRRLLEVDSNQNQSSPLPRKSEPRTAIIEPDRSTSKRFVQRVLAHEFRHGFERRGRYPYMFENKHRLVYFQNFNAAYDNAWYRLGADPRQILATSTKEASVCFTIPAENEYYLIPCQDIEKQAKNAGWKRAHLEVNIDRLRSYWRELKWDLAEYKKHLERA